MRSFCGIVGGTVAPGTVRRLTHAMDFRGKKTFRHWQQEQTLLLTAEEGIRMHPEELRLGPQHYVLACCGRLTNADEIRWDLLEQKHLLVENTQEELLLHSYAQWGRDCVLHLRGSFAFAVWDELRKELFLARDPMGVQTVFWTMQQQTLLFSTELKTILAHPDFRAQIDETGVAELLLLGPGRTPGSGVLRGISELEPGCTLLWKDGRVHEERYWKLQDGSHQLDFEQTSQLIEETVTKKIREQLEPDAGCFLSGGLDSGIVCAVAAQNRQTPLKTFSVDYEGNDRYFVPGKFQPSSDTAYMGILEQALHSVPHRVVLTAEALEGGLEDAVIARDLPGMGDVDISLLLFGREIRKEVPVVLSGECADELFGGYPWYRDPQIRDRAGFPWARSTQRRLELVQPGIFSREQAEAFLRSRYDRTVEEADISSGTSALECRMKQMMNLNVRWFLQTLMERNRTMSAFSDLEIRSPFCDAELATLMYRIPWEMKDHGNTEKGLLRHAFRELLPPEICNRKKSPYPKTYDPRFLHLMQHRMKRLLEDRAAPLWQLVRPEAVEQLSGAEDGWPFYGQLMRTPQTLCYLLELDFWLRQYHVDVVS